MLWKKESYVQDAPYLDILEKYDYDVSSLGANSKSETKKNNKLSNHYSNKAKQQLMAKNWPEAIELFNQALCFAENDSVELGCAYADRSSCFFHLKLYDECLVDITLAKSNNCPARILPKLHQWKETCENLLKKPTDTTPPAPPKLSFDANAQYPCAADALHIERNQNHERCVVAQRNIGVGQTVLIENGFVWSTIEKYRRCCVCLKTASNLVPCTDCSGSLMCHDKCEKSELHRIECDMDLSVKDDDEALDLQLVVRSILTAMKIIPNISELMRFVQHVLADEENGNRTSDSVSTALSQYSVFLENGLKWQWPKKQTSTFVRYINQMYQGFMENDDFRELFDEVVHDRFLMHLIGHHICAVRYGMVAVATGENDGTLIYPIVGRFFEHSCYPNAVLVTSDRSSIAVTIRPIEEGEKVTISYLPDELNLSTRDRRQHLLERYRVLCKCERCEGTTTVAYNSKNKLSQQSKNDIGNPSHLDPKKAAKRRKLTEQCVKYLNSNGRDKWCDNINLVLHTYMHLLRTKHYLNLQH